jgi:hypothetical protein
MEDRAEFAHCPARTAWINVDGIKFIVRRECGFVKYGLSVFIVSRR